MQIMWIQPNDDGEAVATQQFDDWPPFLFDLLTHRTLKGQCNQSTAAIFCIVTKPSTKTQNKISIATIGICCSFELHSAALCSHRKIVRN